MSKQEPGPTPPITEEKLGKALELYDELMEMDNSRLRNRLHRTFAQKRSSRRRRIIAASCAAAVVLPLLVLGGLRLFTQGGFGGGSAPEVWSSESVLLTLSDGNSITLDRISDDGTVADDDGALFLTRDGLLTVEKKGGYDEPAEIRNHTVYVPKGKQYDMMLEDGTRVWLNSDSRVRFPSVFGNGERRVEIEGEVYFQVRADAARPFVVEAGGQEVTVLGTEFNVAAYPEDALILTTLVSGKVSVANGHGMETILRPNEQAEFDRTSKGISVREVNAPDVAAWKDGFFAFDENTLEQVLQKLSRWYNIEVSFRDESLKSIMFKGTLPKFDDVERVLGFIEKSGTVKFDLRGNRVIVSK